jgi:hypothetical protein
VEIRERKGQPSDGTRDGICRIEAEKPNTGSFAIYVDIRPHIALGKVAQPGHAWSPYRPDISHLKRDQGNPSNSIECVHREPVGKRLLDNIRWNWPMDKQ